MPSLEFFDTNFMPHGHCYFWQPEIVWSHAISDALIAVSYFIIPYALINLIRKRPDLKYKNLFLLFGVFIVACGTTHILSIINIWEPFYRLDAFVKIVTAIASVGTTIVLLRIVPQAVNLPTMAQWESINQHLKDQIESLKEKDKTIEKVKEFQFLADSIPQIIWTSNAQGQNDYYNKHWYEYTGLNWEQTKGWGWTPIIHSEDIDRCIKIWEDCMKTGNDYEIEYRFKRASDHQYRWHLGRAIAMKDDMGQIVKWFGTCTDIHELKITREQVRNVDAKFQTLINNAPVIIWAVDDQGIYTVSEGKGLESIGLKPGEIVGLKAKDFLSKTVSPWYENIQKALQGEVSNDINEFGESVFETNFSPIKNDENAILGMVGISVDITKRKKAETESHFKSRFLANMSHEIRTPLNAVIGFAKLLQKSPLNVDQQHYVEFINQSGELLLKLIGDILDLSKIEEGKVLIEEESFHLKQGITSSLHPYKFKAQEAGLEFNIVFDPKLPDYFIGDRYHLNQVLINLLGNALKFTKKGKIEVRIDRIKDTDRGIGLRFSVADSGIGIPKEKQEVIFKSFSQADASIHKEFGGSGLGLAIAQQLVALMHGELHIISPHDHFYSPIGSCFWFDIYLKEDVQLKTALKAEKEEMNFHNAIKVLVVEDNEVNQILAKIVLKNIGCLADFANNGKECLTFLENEGDKYACVLMDIQMPVMDGIEATNVIRKEYNKTIPIIGLSANVYKEDIQKSLKAGMNDHIGKPYTEEQLYNAIKKWTY